MGRSTERRGTGEVTASALRYHRLLLFIVLSLIVLAPIALVRMPMLSDYPNHLARMHVLATIDESPTLQRYYKVEWRLFPYLSMDAVVPWLARLMPIYDAGRLFIVACMLLPVAGVMAIHYVVYRRIGWVTFAAFLFTYNQILAFGFMNYLFAVGLALLLLAAWMASEPWPRTWRIAAFAIAAAALYLAHVYAFIVYGLAVAGYEVGRSYRRRFRPLAGVAADWLTAGAQAVPALILAAFGNMTRHAGGVTSYGSLEEKLGVLSSPISFLGSRLDTGIALVVLAVFIGGLLARRVRLSPVVAPIAIALGLVAACVPEWLLGVWGADLRLPLVVALVLVAGATVEVRPRTAFVLVAALVLLVAVKSAHAWWTLAAVDRQVAELRRMLDQLPPGSRLLVAHVPRAEVKTQVAPYSMTAHAALLATIARDAFVPSLFTGMTTLEVQPALQSLADTHLGKGLAMGDLAAAADGRAPIALGQHQPVYWRDWPLAFDYVLWQHFGGGLSVALPRQLEAVATGTNFNLYRVVR